MRARRDGWVSAAKPPQHSGFRATPRLREERGVGFRFHQLPRLVEVAPLSFPKLAQHFGHECLSAKLSFGGGREQGKRVRGRRALEGRRSLAGTSVPKALR